VTFFRCLIGAAAAAVAWLLVAAAPSEVVVRVTDPYGIPLTDAVVEIEQPGGADRPIVFPWRNAMAQRDLAFVPGTLIVPVGAKVAFPNLDTVRHSVYSFSRAATFEIELYGRDQTRSQTFEIPGTVALGCNIHDGMRGYIRVVDTPFAAKTDGSGYARIAGVAPGAIRVTVWHPRLKATGNELTRALQTSSAAIELKVPVR